eukprot:3435423-Alexandrium_andersonii.AAC.1
MGLQHASQRIANPALGARRPYLLVGSPPCADRCPLKRNINHPRMDNGEVRERLGEARAHVEFAIELYRSQLAR